MPGEWLEGKEYRERERERGGGFKGKMKQAVNTDSCMSTS